MKSALFLLGLSVWVAHNTQAQSFCASDGQPTPVALVERFISADCEACWSAPQTVQPTPRTLTLDWIVPGTQGDAAPLSAAASRDASLRLASLGRPATATSTLTTTPVSGARGNQLRVAHGLPFGGYLGASIELKTTLAPPGPVDLNAWLLLVETIPAGTDGTPTPRNLVRNVLLHPWHKPDQLLNGEQAIFYEMRALNIPTGATPARLRVVGWVQDGRGRILTAAQSVCVPMD